MPENDVIRKLEKLYAELPGVPCIPGCTECCVSPTITLIEFISLMSYLYDSLNEDDIDAMICSPIMQHPKFEGNFYCKMQKKNGYCSIHPGRSLACRMHGLPVIDNLGVTNMENCTIMDPNELPDVPVDIAKSWLDRLLKLNQDLIPSYGDDFYCIIGLNLECWMDILFIDNLSVSELREMQRIMRSMVPIDKYQITYSQKTEIFEKIDTISLLKMTLEMGDNDSVEQILQKIKSGYPTTGTYFHDRCDWMLEKIKNEPAK